MTEQIDVIKAYSVIKYNVILFSITGILYLLIIPKLVNLFNTQEFQLHVKETDTNS